jgi:hypothetical protein
MFVNQVLLQAHRVVASSSGCYEAPNRIRMIEATKGEFSKVSRCRKILQDANIIHEKKQRILNIEKLLWV